MESVVHYPNALETIPKFTQCYLGNLWVKYLLYLWGIRTTTWLIWITGEYRSIIEAQKSNLVQELAKTIKLETKLHTQCEQKQDNFRLYNHETCYY